MTCRTDQLNSTLKTQAVRVMDVFMVGPLMIFGGMKLRQHNPILGSLLEFFGTSTIVYNARNFYVIDRAYREERAAGIEGLGEVYCRRIEMRGKRRVICTRPVR